MRKFLKSFCCLLAALFTLNAAATEMPALSYVLSLKIYFLPKELNKEVQFTFSKRDNNGRAGADALAFTVYSPSEKAVFEYTIPDDGETGHEWKFGPRQPVDVRFTPTEKGVYTLEFKMDCDAYLYFDNNTVKNTYVAMNNTRFRTGTCTPAHLFFYMPINKVGERGIIDISSSYMHYNQITNMTISDGKTVFYDKFTAKPAPDKKHIFAHHFFIRRSDPEALYELKADQFGLINFVPKLYPALTFFFSKEGAEAFKPYFFKNNIQPNSFALTAANAAQPFALAPGEIYNIRYIPAKTQDFNFQAEILGKKYTICNSSDSVIVNVPANNCFPEIKTSAKLDGKFLLSRVVNSKPSIEMPADAEVVKPVNSKITFRALQVKNAKKYTFHLTHQSGKKIQFDSAAHEVTRSFYDFAPGVWQISCSTDNSPAGKSSCFAIPKFRKTSPAYIYGFKPASDSTVKTFSEISCKPMMDLEDIDLNKTTFTVNGKKYPVEILKKCIGIPANKIKLADGKIDIIADIYDRYGNYSRYEWCFMLNVNIRKTISFNQDGIMLFNGRKFLPLICYPPNPGIPGDTGFNTVLPNTLTDLRALDVYMKNNVKSLDSGCVYHGYYTAKDSTPLQDVDRYLKGPGGTHPARIGAWLDEADAHISDAHTKKTLENYQRFSLNCGVAGVCTTGRNRYADMAKMGDYLMIDIYPRENVLSVDYYFQKAIKDAAGKPVWQLNQGFDYDYSNRDHKTMIPNPAMLKYAHWASFRHSLQAVGLYMCGETKYCFFPPLWEDVKVMYRQASALSFALVEPAVKEQILTAPQPLSSKVIRFGERYYLIVQNSSWKAFSAQLEVKGNFAPQVRVLFEDRVLELKDGKFQDVFQAIESRVYELTVK